MLNQLVALREDLAYLETLPRQEYVSWDKEFHDYNEEWRFAGRPSTGWWRCREDGAASNMELECCVCHQADEGRQTVGYRNQPKIRLTRAMVIQRIDNIENFMSVWSKRAGEMDRQAVLAE